MRISLATFGAFLVAASTSGIVPGGAIALIDKGGDSLLLSQRQLQLPPIGARGPVKKFDVPISGPAEIELYEGGPTIQCEMQPGEGRMNPRSCESGMMAVTVVDAYCDESLGSESNNNCYAAIIRDGDTGKVWRVTRNGEVLGGQRGPSDYPEDSPSPNLEDLPSSNNTVRSLRGETIHARSLQPTSVIDVMVAYTQGAEDGAAENGEAIRELVDLAIEQTNRAYVKSGINARLNLVDIHKAEDYNKDVEYTEDPQNAPSWAKDEKGNVDVQEIVLYHLTYQQGEKWKDNVVDPDGLLDYIHQRRSDFCADMVAMITSGEGSPGIAWLGQGSNDKQFSVIRYDLAIDNLSFAHELGHNMDCYHDKGKANKCGDKANHYGYRDPAGKYRSIMAYDCKTTSPTPQCDGMSSATKSCPRLAFFSNPDIKYEGLTMGYGAIDPMGPTDCAATIDSAAQVIAKFYDTCAPGKLCGNNLLDLEAGERCDGDDLGSETCLTQGFSGGTLACLDDCSDFNTEDCTGPGPVCGNNDIEGPETCDGTDLDGETCLTQGFTGGTLACLPDCSDFNTEDCTVCGDNILEQPGETCDGTDLGGETCLTQGFCGGLLECLGDCSGFDTSQCEACPVCGNDLVEAGEICDGTDLDGETCLTQGFCGGTLACKKDCSAFKTGGCELCPVCGNNLIEAGETCDGTDLDDEDCVSQGFCGGTLACKNDCSAFKTGGCIPCGPVAVSGGCEACPVCGNNLVEADETCDRDNLNGETCETQGFCGGLLACKKDCSAFKTGGCIPCGPLCGNNFVEPGETCDGTDIEGETCVTQGFCGGTLACKGDCSGFDTSGCTVCSPEVKTVLIGGRDGRLCVPSNGGSEVTVDVKGEYKWFLNRGGFSGSCIYPSRMKRSDKIMRTYCRRINRKYHQLRAPMSIENWLLDIGWEIGTCDFVYNEDVGHFIRMRYHKVDVCTCPCRCDFPGAIRVRRRRRCKCLCDCGNPAARRIHNGINMRRGRNFFD